MAFYNIETKYPNTFLLLKNHDHSCFCNPCRRRRFNAVENSGEQTLRTKLVVGLPNERRARSMAVFEVTKEQIIIGNAYKESCIATTHLKYFKCWAKIQPYYQEFVNGDKTQRKEFDDHCKLVNNASTCFKNWEKIVENLTDRRMTAINARTFSVEQFSNAVSIDVDVGGGVDMEHENDQERRRKRHRTPKPTAWKSNVSKRRRSLCLDYIGKRDLAKNGSM